jgi:hypothetical protein
VLGGRKYSPGRKIRHGCAWMSDTASQRIGTRESSNQPHKF